MEEYKGNSNKSKELSEQPTLKKVATSKKFLRLLLVENVPDLRKFIMDEVVRPGICKLVNTYIGNDKHTTNNSNEVRVSYKDYSTSKNSGPTVSSSSYWTDTEEIEFNTYGDAKIILDAMDDMLSRFKKVRVADMYDLCHLVSPHTAYRYGWYDIRSARIIQNRHSGRYVIEMPRAVPIFD